MQDNFYGYEYDALSLEKINEITPYTAITNSNSR